MPNAQRLNWPDAAKGFCIALVVLSHLTFKHYLSLEWPVPDVAESAWVRITKFLAPVRMPLFFAISGYFAAKYIEHPWRNVWRKRVAATYYLYLVWFILHVAFFFFGPGLNTQVPESASEVLLGLVWGYTSMWYLYALPVYFLFAWSLSKWKVQALTLAAALSLLSGSIESLGNGQSVSRNLVFFMLAAYAPHLISKYASDPKGKMVISIGGIFVVTSVVSTEIGLISNFTGTYSLLILAVAESLKFTVGLLGISLGVTAFAWLNKALPTVSSACAWLGQRTLSVYVLHLPILAGLNILLAGTDVPFWLMLVYPMLILPLIIFFCIALQRIFVIFHANWLFVAPAALRTGRTLAP